MKSTPNNAVHALASWTTASHLATLPFVRRLRPAVLFAVMAIGSGCGGTVPPPSTIGPSPVPFQEQNQEPSLFPGDAEVLSDSAIRRILAYDLALPSTIRIAILELGTRAGYRSWWSEEAARLNTHITDTLITSLVGDPRVSHADVLPLLLVPIKRTVPYLREAAARFQADLMLIYQPACGVFERARFLAPNEYRITCTVEAVVLDTRSGVVPFTGVRTRSLVVRRQDEDFDERDMRMRGQFQVVAEAIGAVAEDLLQLLTGVPMQ